MFEMLLAKTCACLCHSIQNRCPTELRAPCALINL